MCMYDDSDGWKVNRWVHRRAAKDHRCGECRRTIAKGETYRYFTGLSYDFDTWSTFRICAHCEEVTKWLVVACSGFMFEAVEEDLFEHITGSEFYLRSRPLTRLGRWMRDDWRDRNGVLRPLEAVEQVRREAVDAYKALAARGLA